MKEFWLKWRREIVRGAFLFTTVVVVGLLVISWVNRGISSIPRRFGLNFNSDFDTDFPGLGPGRTVSDTWSVHARVAPAHWVWIHNTNGPIRVEPARGDSVERPERVDIERGKRLRVGAIEAVAEAADVRTRTRRDQRKDDAGEQR